MYDEKTVEGAIDRAGRYWRERRDGIVGEAGAVFMGFVEPALLYGEAPALPREALSLMFTEWLVFEYPAMEGATPFAWCAAHPEELGRDLPEAERRCLGEVARTQFFSRFEILDKDAESGTVTLRDVCDGRRYDAYSPYVCAKEGWRRGTVAERIARFDGLWYDVGRVHLYDRAPLGETGPDGPGMFHPEDRERRPEAERAGFYLRLVRDVIGIEGRYRETATF